MGKIKANIIDCESVKEVIEYDDKTMKEMVFIFPFVDNGILGPCQKFAWSGSIKSVDAYCNTPGKDDTKIDIEIISEDDFKTGIDSWASIFKQDMPIIIPGNSNHQDDSYDLREFNLQKNSIFRINFLDTGEISKPIDNTRIRNLTIQINIIID